MTSVNPKHPRIGRVSFAPFALALATLLALCASSAFAGSWVVTTGTDGPQKAGDTSGCHEVTGPGSITTTGFCSLRAAIELSNNLSGSHTITFNPGITVTIVNGALDTVMAPITITGTPITRTVLNGSGHGCFNLTDSGTVALNHGSGATGSTIANMVIGNCGGYGISANGHSYTFTNNYIGVSSTGTVAFPNTQDGIYLSASAVYDDSIIGTQPLLDLYNNLPAQPVDETQVATFKSTLLTALSSLSPNLITGNVISGNTQNGITISSQNLAATIVSGNFIGTDPTGNTAIANGGSGVRFIGGSFGNLISGNTISGNAQHGIEVDSDVFLPNWIMGNRIGLPTVNGMHVGNGLSGIYVSTYPATSGHANPSGVALVIGPANVIADNQGANNNAFPDLLGSNGGIVVTSPSQGIKLLGNRIGIPEFPAGTPVATTAYGNKGDGIIITVSGIKIGGSGATDGNVIAGNARHGIVVSGSATSATSILGNSIGVDPMLSGNLSIGNGVDGIHIDAANSTTIGGSGSTDFNTVAGNGRNGIKIRNGNFTNGWSNASQRNLVYHNATTQPPLQFGHDGVGIDLDYAEDAANSLHGEYLGPSYSYANFDQAQPVICAGPADTGKCSGSLAPSSSGGSTTLQWTIATHGPAQFRMDFFRIDTADDNTATGMTFIGEQSISSDPSIYPAPSYPADSAACSGGVCTVTLPASTGGGYIIMTATDVTPLTNAAAVTGDWKDSLKCFIGDLGVILSSCPVNNTSEFSNVASVPGAAPTVVTVAASAITTTTATLNATISANGADSGTSFEYGPTVAYGSSINGSPATVTAAQSNVAVVGNILSGLTCGTTYHFRAEALNSNGLTLGNDLTFTTAPCAVSLPTAVTIAASAVSATGATLNGTVSANGATTTVSFDYGTTASYGTNVTATQSPLSSGSISSPVSYVLSGLTCNTTYHFRVNAINDGATTIHGSDLSFTTAVCAPIAPTVTSVAASGISATGATLNGTVSANGAIAAVTFDFGTTTAYGAIGSPAAAAQSPLSSGASGAAVSLTLSGLACNTTYHFRANANNGVGGTINGGDLQFTTGACVQPPPNAITSAASAVAATSATLNGLVSANGASTTVTFDYGPTAAYGGSGSPGTAAQSPLAAGSGSNAPVTFALAGLTCGTTYHFRVNATNTGGTVHGIDTTFSTASCAASSPSVVTDPASGITTTSAVLNGTVSANGAATTVAFDFGLTSSYGGAGSPATAAQSPLSSGASGALVTYALSGLTCATTYHFRANANNGVGGTINGTDQQFTTAACPGTPPTANTGSAGSITTTGATLNGTVSANGAQTTVTFEYGTTTSYGLSAAAAQSPLAAGSPANAAVTAALSGLSCGTQYHFRVDANNGTGGTIHGNDAMFTTSTCPVQPPSATTDAASAITATSATLNGTVSANGTATTVSFDYGTTNAYGSNVVAAQSPLAANASNAAVSASVSSLSCNQLYHFRVNTDNGSGGPVYGTDQTFTTAACAAQPPSATTDAASAVTATSATLNATVSANGAATTVSFDYGTTTAYGSNAAAAQSPLAANASNAAASAVVSSLSCNQLYHFRVKTDNGNGGPVYGGDLTFTTSACASQAPTATSLAATAIGTTSATINGTVNANGATTTVSFAYGPDASYGSTIAATPASLPANAVGTAVSATLSGLTCATTYHFRVDANNTNGSGHGGDLSLTTAACPVTTFTGPTATGTGSATAVLSGGGPSCSLVSPAFVAASGSLPPGVSFPDGLFQFQASGCTGSVTLTVTFPTAFAAGVQYWKYGPTPGQASDHWYTLGAANGLSLAGHVATFTIADGGLGDDDLSVNGTIIDAGGPSLAAVAPQSAIPAPMFDPRSLAALIALLALCGAAAVRTQRKASP